MKTATYAVENSGSADVRWSLTFDDGNYDLEVGEEVCVSGGRKSGEVGRVIKVKINGLNHLGTKTDGDAIALEFENGTREFFGWFKPNKEQFIFPF